MVRLALALLLVTIAAGVAWIAGSTGTTSANQDAATKRPERAPAVESAATEPLSLPESEPREKPATAPERDAIDPPVIAVLPARQPTDEELAREYDALLPNALEHEIERLEKSVNEWSRDLIEERFASGQYEVVLRVEPGEDRAFRYTPELPEDRDLLHSVRFPAASGEVQLVVLERNEYPELYARHRRLEIARERLAEREE